LKRLPIKSSYASLEMLIRPNTGDKEMVRGTLSAAFAEREQKHKSVAELGLVETRR
jgi:hypothetical protein